jgi:hypothetical protein
LILWQNQGEQDLMVSYVLETQLPKPDYSGLVLASWVFFGLLAVFALWKLKALFKGPEAPRGGRKSD